MQYSEQLLWIFCKINWSTSTKKSFFRKTSDVRPKKSINRATSPVLFRSFVTIFTTPVYQIISWKLLPLLKIASTTSSKEIRRTAPQVYYLHNKTSRSGMFYTNRVLKNLLKLKEIQLCRCLFLINRRLFWTRFFQKPPTDCFWKTLIVVTILLYHYTTFLAKQTKKYLPMFTTKIFLMIDLKVNKWIC